MVNWDKAMLRALTKRVKEGNSFVSTLCSEFREKKNRQAIALGCFDQPLRIGEINDRGINVSDNSLL